MTDYGVLPTVNASFNAAASVCLLVGHSFMKRGRVTAHRNTMLTAFVLSSLFLVGYLIHHAEVGNVPFHGPAALRAVYFAILIPHVILAATVVPLALRTIYLALKGEIDRHRRIARVTYPIWLYVSASGVAVYWMLYRL